MKERSRTPKGARFVGQISTISLTGTPSRNCPLRFLSCRVWLPRTNNFRIEGRGRKQLRLPAPPHVIPLIPRKLLSISVSSQMPHYRKIFIQDGAATAADLARFTGECSIGLEVRETLCAIAAWGAALFLSGLLIANPFDVFDGLAVRCLRPTGISFFSGK